MIGIKMKMLNRFRFLKTNFSSIKNIQARQEKNWEAV